MGDKSYLANLTNSYLDQLLFSEWRGADLLIFCLLKEGVKDIFGVNGGAVLEIYHRLPRTPIKIWDMAHEQGAVHAAEGYNAVTGRPGVVLVTSGPGLTNTLTGITDAYMDSRGVVVISGQVPREMIGKMAFQEAPVTAMSQSVTKYNILVTEINKLPHEVKKVFALSTNGRPGPTHLDIPKDLQQTLVGDTPEILQYENIQIELPEHVDQELERKLDDVVNLLNKSRKPVIYVGGGVVTARAFKELDELSTLLYAPVVTTLMARTAYRNSELNLGMLGMHGTEYANWAVDKCDVLLNLGARFDDRVTGDPRKFAPNAKKVHVDIDQKELNKNVKVDVGIVGDVKYVMRRLLQKVREHSEEYRALHQEWVEQVNQYRKQHLLRFRNNGRWVDENNYYEMLKELRNSEIIKPQHVMLELRELLAERNPIITTGVGRHQMWAAQYLGDLSEHFITSGGLGTMGFGLPAAIGAKVARPDSLVLNIDGDRSFLMTLQQLDVLRRYNLPVKIIILNDGGHGMVRQWQDTFYRSNYVASAYPSPDFVKIAEGLGVDGTRVNSARELRAELEKMIDSNKPFVLDVKVDPNEHVLPMIPPKGSFNQMICPK